MLINLLCAKIIMSFTPTEIAMGLQAAERSETIHTRKRREHACTCSSLNTHRCPLHNDTLEHNCTSKNIVPGLIVPSDERLDTPQPVEDRCICSSLHVHGNSVNVHYHHRCPVHNDTMKHDCTHDNIVTGKTNFVQFDRLPLKISSSPQQVKDTCTCSMLHFQENSVHKYQYRCPVHNDTEEHNCTLKNTVTGRYKNLCK